MAWAAAITSDSSPPSMISPSARMPGSPSSPSRSIVSCLPSWGAASRSSTRQATTRSLLLRASALSATALREALWPVAPLAASRNAPSTDSSPVVSPAAAHSSVDFTRRLITVPYWLGARSAADTSSSIQSRDRWTIVSSVVWRRSAMLSFFDGVPVSIAFSSAPRLRSALALVTAAAPGLEIRSPTTF